MGVEHPGDPSLPRVLCASPVLYAVPQPMNGTRNLKIACIGAGYVGGPTMAVIASKSPP
eukprot:ctg_4942.g593